MQRKKKQPVLVVGAGNFGTCLAQHLALQGHKVSLWLRSPAEAEAINTQHRNPRYLTSVPLAKSIRALSDLARGAAELPSPWEVIVLAVPTQALRSVLTEFAKTPGLFTPDQLIVSAAKGIEMGSERLPSQIVGDVLGKNHADSMVVLSGPSFASEIAVGQPTGVSVASLSSEHAQWAQAVFHSPRFRVYTSADPVGLEVAGALKNVIAIAAGACGGLGFQANSRATLITRGLAEITRVGMALGADPLTFKGLGGVGDLFLTCSSEKSRNYTVGHRLGQGESLAAVLSSVGSVAEGVSTTRSAYSLGQRLGVSIPITSAVYQVLYEDKPITKVVHELITRDARPEQG